MGYSVLCAPHNLPELFKEVGTVLNLRKSSLSGSTFALLAFAALSGCAAGPDVTPGLVPDGPSFADIAASPAAPAAPQIRPFDTLAVTVLREPDLTMPEVLVRGDGTFMMPLIGSVGAAGKSPDDIAEDIRARLAARYLVDPVVAVNVAEYGSHMVTVEGAVEKPGIYTFNDGTTLLGAVALGGGPSTSVARLNEVAIFRTVGGETYAAAFDLKKIRAGQMADPQIQPGDRVVIGFSSLGQGLENVLRAAPVVGLFFRY